MHCPNCGKEVLCDGVSSKYLCPLCHKPFSVEDDKIERLQDNQIVAKDSFVNHANNDNTSTQLPFFQDSEEEIVE